GGARRVTGSGARARDSAPGGTTLTVGGTPEDACARRRAAVRVLATARWAGRPRAARVEPGRSPGRVPAAAWAWMAAGQGWGGAGPPIPGERLAGGPDAPGEPDRLSRYAIVSADEAGLRLDPEEKARGSPRGSPLRDSPPQGHRQGGEAPRDPVRTGDQQSGRRPFDRPLEPDEDGPSHSSEGPRWEIAQVDRDDLEATAPHEGIGRRPGQA